MNIRYHMLLTVSITAVFVCLSIGSDAMAQAYAPGGPPFGVYYQPPSMCPTCPSMYGGVFYISGGLKWRSFEASFEPVPLIPPCPTTNNNSFCGFNFTTSTSSPFVINLPGTVPIPPTFLFGPGTADPTFVPGDVWNYTNGSISSLNPGGPIDQAWAPGLLPSNALGHDSVLILGALTPRNTGSFTITDPSTQTNNAGGTISQTTAVTFLLAPNPGTGTSTSGTIVLAASPNGTSVTLNRSTVVGPYIEVGYQSESLFDVFLAFSPFSFSDSFGTVVPYDVNLVDFVTTNTTNAQDTFTFSSSNGAATWSAFTPFNSATSTVADTNSYLIQPLSLSRTTVTTSSTSAGTVTPFPLGTLTDTLTSRLDASVYESKIGGRSWVPLWGMGRFNVGFGFLSACIPFTISTSSLATTTADITDPSTGLVTFPAGTIFRQTAAQESGTQYNFGLFTSTGMELGYYRWFAAGGIEYDWYWAWGPRVDSFVNTEFRPTGVGADLRLGVRF